MATGDYNRSGYLLRERTGQRASSAHWLSDVAEHFSVSATTARATATAEGWPEVSTATTVMICPAEWADVTGTADRRTRTSGLALTAASPGTAVAQPGGVRSHPAMGQPGRVGYRTRWAESGSIPDQADQVRRKDPAFADAGPPCVSLPACVGALATMAAVMRRTGDGPTTGHAAHLGPSHSRPPAAS